MSRSINLASDTTLQRVATALENLNTSSSGGSSIGERTENGGEVFNDYESNNAYGPYTHSEGSGAISGVMGYYFTKFHLYDGARLATLFLSKEQTSSETEERNLDFTIDYVNGDVISYVYGSKYLDVAAITDVDNEYKTITIEALEGKTLGTGVFDTGIDDQIVYVYTKPSDGVVSLGHYAHAEGEKTQAIERSSHAEGRSTIARGQYSHAEGRQTKADYAAHAEGYLTEATNNYSHAEGYAAKANGIGSHSEGYSSKAIGNYSHSEGSYSEATGDNSHAEGISTIAKGANSHAEGYHSEANGVDSHAEGYTTQANGERSHAEGISTIADGMGSHAEGGGAKANGQYSHAEGGGTIADGMGSHAEGNSSKAIGNGSHAEGNQSEANGVDSHAEGYTTQANGDYSHAEGDKTTADGIGSHTEGYFTFAIGNYSHVEGISNAAKGDASHAEGYNSIARGNYQHVEGTYNIEDIENKYLHIAGNGSGDMSSPNPRSNAYTLDWNGNAWFAGDVECTSIVLRSSTEGSSKKFKITVDDNGNLSATEIVME